MEEAIAARYWCHMCSQMVNPIMEVEMKCPFCQNGFIEEMSGPTRENQESEAPELGADRALSLWAPILLGMMGNRTRQDENGVEESELDREIDSIIRRRRRSSATILQLLQSIQAGMAAEAESSEGDRERERGDADGDRERDRERERERVILINPFNQTIIVQGASQIHHNPIGSLGDYFIGPGLDLLLQHLAENDPNRHGTPPAHKDAVEAMPSVKIEESVQCSVCLDDMEAGTEAKEMPCKHKFHPDCILPWLELHSSCPVCRFQLPADESKREPDGDGSIPRGGISNDNGRDIMNGSSRLSFPWPFTGLFSTPLPPTSDPPASGSASQTQPDQT